MKITGDKIEHSAIASSEAPNLSPDPDLLQRHPSSRRPPRRKIKNSGAGVRLRKDVSVTPSGRRSRPQTPLLRWKFDEDVGVSNGCDAQEEEYLGRKCHLETRPSFSARKLAAGIWRLQLPEVPCNGEKLGFQGGVGHAGIPFYSHHHSKAQDSPDSVESSPHSVSGPRRSNAGRTFHQVEPSFQFSNTAMEGATKWDPITWKSAEGTNQIHGRQQTRTPMVISVLEEELEQARARVKELETEQQSYKKKIEQFLKKVSEERSAWRSREHERIQTILDDMKADLNRERKTRQRLEIINSKLVSELGDAKSSLKRYVQDYEKERKTRELIEEVCDELAKEIGEDKAEVEVLKRECARFREEVDEERRMLQMAEVWREERVQMKLIDAKVALEEKYSQMNRLIADLESLLCSRGATTEEMKSVEQLQQAAASVNIHDIQEFTYAPPNPDDIFPVFEDNNCVSQYNGYAEDGSEWETVSHVDDGHGSSYSPDGSDPSINKTPVTDISEVCSTPLKKTSSVSKLWRYSNGGGIMSPDRESSSLSSGNTHLNRGMKGCIEWPRNLQKHSLKTKLLEARMESQKVQLRHVLKQKI